MPGLQHGPLDAAAVHLCIDMQRLFAPGSPWQVPWLVKILSRVERCHAPYHNVLEETCRRVHREFGAAMLIDCHSMPSSTGPKDERPRADVVLGDRYGTSCVAAVSEVIETTLRQQGYAVSRNKPYAGGYITEHYGRPHKGQHALQIEVNRALYMDETSFEKSSGFARLREDLETVVRALMAGVFGLAIPRAAAE